MGGLNFRFSEPPTQLPRLRELVILILQISIGNPQARAETFYFAISKFKIGMTCFVLNAASKNLPIMEREREKAAEERRNCNC